MRLDRIDPRFPEVPHDDKEIDERVEKNRARMADQQLRIYAERRHSVLIVLQGLDASGKDSVVKHILSTMNPMSCTVAAFKVPTPEEAAHDFLWRHHKSGARQGLGIDLQPEPLRSRAGRAGPQARPEEGLVEAI